MKVKTIIDNENGKKIEIIKHENKQGFPYPVYTVNYFEFYKACGWREISNGAKHQDYYTKEAIEKEFEIKVA